MRTCAVCKKFAMPGHNNVFFHKFPSDTALKEKWMLAIGISSVTKSATVCSDHFDESAYHQTDGYTSLKRLLPNAVPICPSISQCSKENKKANEKEVSGGDMTTFAHDSLSDDGLSIAADVRGSPIENNIRATENIPADTFKSTTSVLLPTFTSVFEDTNFKADNVRGSRNSTSMHKMTSSTDIPVLVNISGNCSNHKRKNVDAVDAVVPKKVRFMDGYETKYISRSDFVSDEAWERFLRFNVCKRKQQDKSIKKNKRQSQKIESMNELVEALKEKESLSAAEYVEV